MDMKYCLTDATNVLTTIIITTNMSIFDNYSIQVIYSRI